MKLNNVDRELFQRAFRSRFLIALFSCGSMESWCRERHDPLFNEGELPLMLGLRVNQTLHHTNIFCRPLYLQGPNHNTRTPPAPRDRDYYNSRQRQFSTQENSPCEFAFPGRAITSKVKMLMMNSSRVLFWLRAWAYFKCLLRRELCHKVGNLNFIPPNICIKIQHFLFEAFAPYVLTVARRKAHDTRGEIYHTFNGWSVNFMWSEVY